MGKVYRQDKKSVQRVRARDIVPGDIVEVAGKRNHEIQRCICQGCVRFCCVDGKFILNAGDRHKPKKLLMLIIQKIEKSETQNPRRNSSEDSDNTQDHENSNLTMKNNKKLNKETIKKRLL